MFFLNELAGHDKIKESLGNACLSGRFSHAYLFSGPPGVGKTTAGKSFARVLLCRQEGDDACGRCDDCTRIERGVHPDFKVIKPQGASIKISQLRELQDSAGLTAFGDGRQVFLLEQAEKLTTAAANCLLKILEEPPAGVVFILIVNSHTGVLPTIVSRCQHFRFHSLSEQDVLKVLDGLTGGNEGQMRAAARLAQGSPGRALAIIEDANKRRTLLDILLRLVRNRPYSALLPVAELETREDFSAFVNQAVMIFRDALVWQMTGAVELLINLDCTEVVTEIAGTYEEQELMEILLTLEQTIRRLTANVNHRLLFDALMTRIGGIREV